MLFIDSHDYYKLVNIQAENVPDNIFVFHSVVSLKSIWERLLFCCCCVVGFFCFVFCHC